MIAVLDVEHVLSESRAVREEVAAMRRQAQQTRLEVQWQRGRARKQLRQLEQKVQQMSVTLAETPRPLEWRPAQDALDGVLIPLD